MVKPTKNVRRDNAAKKIEPKPCWVQAFLIKMLYKQGGSETLSVGDLKGFEALKGDNKTKLDYDVVAQTVTITAPPMTLPEKSKIIHNENLKLN